MPLFGIGQQDEDLESLQMEREKLEVRAKNADLELSVAEKKYALQKLKEQGLSKNDVGGTWSGVRRWLKEHGLW